MPEKWRQMELDLAAALTVEEQADNGEEETAVAAWETQEEDQPELATDADKVAFLVEVPEKMWRLLDEGESLKALELYQRANEIHDECVASSAEQEFPFLQTQWTCIQCFRPRMVTCAKGYLTCRGKESRFYADNLCTLAVLSDPPVGATKLFEMFLESRSKWMTPLHRKHGEEQPEQTTSKKERALMINLKSISLTMAQTEEIFGDEKKSGLLSSISQLTPSFKHDLETIISSGKMLKMLGEWFQRKRRQIIEVASPIISSINTISLLSQVQSKLYSVNTSSGGCENVRIWSRVIGDAHLAQSSSHDKVSSVPAESVFSILFAEAFRKRTRDLVQHSFVEALEAIKSQVRASLEDTVVSITRGDCRMRNVKFYDYFESIQKKAADLDASDLQSVLIEEFLRTLFNLVVFFEQEFPLPGNQLPDTANRATPLPSVFLSISNILAGIVAGFHHQMNKLFPGSSATVLIPEKDPSVSTVAPLFAKFNTQGFVKKSQLKSLLEVGNAPYIIVIGCEWIATHEGWIEQVISDEGIGGDTDDSSSESEMALGDEKVWLPWCETPTVSSFLFSCCYSLDDANRLVQNSIGTKDEQIKLMQRTIREVLVEQLTIISVAVYDAAVSLLVEAKAGQKDSVLNFGECCIQQFLFDMYFVRATLGFSDFIRFGWGDELNPEDCSPGLLKLKDLFERMREFIDPVDWEIYGPQLIENVVLQFRKSRLLFSSLSESNDINKINGKEIVIGAQDTRPLARIAEPVARFSLLPVPSNRRRFQRTLSSMSRSSEDDATEGRSRANSSTLFHERAGVDDASQSSAMKLQNLLSSSTSSNIFSAATSGTNLLSSAAKGIGFLSSATTNKYF
ncbi:unnamed protein product [Phytophthora lilii]|uniref:Conserved oligomeric Golgi complex subunit 1 n=1 Tax=Phytophthora lilii TaxID=2077276 RepID=A0A9W6T9W0_9STRA|nr:unnamed protein product [Phytophthora lilii]